MKYLVGWSDPATGRMIKETAAIIPDGKSVYDAKSKFLRANWNGSHLSMTAALTMVRARCLEDSRYNLPLSSEALQDPSRAFEELSLSSVGGPTL